jgi:hypothetical protein
MMKEAAEGLDGCRPAGKRRRSVPPLLQEDQECEDIVAIECLAPVFASTCHELNELFEICTVR